MIFVRDVLSEIKDDLPIGYNITTYSFHILIRI